MKIKNDAKKRLERFLWASPSLEEFGGFLLKNRQGLVSEFLPVTNTSQDKRHQFQAPQGALELARKLAYSKRMDVVAFFHSHPDPCIMSVADMSSAGSIYPNLTFVTISPSILWKEYIWYACEGVKPVKIEFV